MAVAALMLSACGGSGQKISIGMRKVGLDLAFRNPRLAPPVQRITVMLPPLFSTGPAFASVTYTVAAPPQTYYLPLRPQGPKCPVAPAGAHPAQASPVAVTSPPTAGMYTAHNKGKINATYATFKLNFSFPPQSAYTLSGVKVTSTGTPPTKTITYKFSSNVAGTETTTTYQDTPTELDLVKQVTKASTGTSTFTPATPVTMMKFLGVGASWESAGVDSSSGTVMTVKGSIAAEQVVDLCGTPFDSYEVVSNETVTNVLTGYTSQTSTSDPNVYNVATQFGGLLLRQHIDESINEGPTFSATEDYTSTLDSAQPVAGSEGGSS